MAQLREIEIPIHQCCARSLDGWNAVADRLTYLDRCWDSRGLSFTVYGEKAPARPKRREFARSRQSVNFHSVMDATTLSSTQEEMLVYGAGENLVFRRKEDAGSKGKDSWSKLAGREAGFAAGTGDVTAISIIQRQQFPEVVVGRATGDLQLLAAKDETLSDASQRFTPMHDINDTSKTPLTKRSPGQRAVSWTEWQPSGQLLASCRSSDLTLYNLSDTEEAVLKPMLFYDVSKDSAADEISLLRSVKFISQDVVACGLGGCSDPLRWAKIRPTGIEMLNVGQKKSAGGDSAEGSEKTTVRSMQPVPKMNENLLLSAWDDGSHR